MFNISIIVKFISGLELTPVKYNSKLMNSIWGMYNRYSPYNFKKSNDTEIAPFVAGDQKYISKLIFLY